MSVLIVTGTDTGVGKTVATAALASCARQSGVDVAVCKPVQTGTAAGDDDLAAVTRLAGVPTVPGARYPEPLAPRAAATAAATTLPTGAQLRRWVTAGDRPGRLTLVEGAGGLLVELGADGLTLRDLAADVDAAVLVVVAAGLGTLNHTALTLEALARDRLRCAGLVIGAWPAHPGAAETDNRVALGRLAPLRAVLPAGAGEADPVAFAALSAAAFDPDWVAALAG